MPVLFARNLGTYLLGESWDNIIILDACRYDVFKEKFKETRMRGRLDSKTTRGTETKTFLLENFGNGRHDDIVCITANPYVDRLLKDRFHRIIPVWKHGWSNEHQTVLPETTYAYALAAIRRYPGKRLIIHFMQPHYPYIGFTLPGALRNVDPKTVRRPRPRIRHKDTLLSVHSSDIYAVVDRATLFRAYKRNLEMALSYVKDLVEILPGKTVVTSDHGEAFGEYIHPLIPIRFYGHARGYRLPVLTKLPWLVIDAKEKADMPRRTTSLGGDIEKRIIRAKIQEMRHNRQLG